jgi:4-hydroxy-tetrahydrodipicolinate synthase
MLSGTLPVIPTPFIEGEIDYPSFKKMLEFFLPFADGYTLSGSTGESPSLTQHERMELVEFAMKHTPKDKTVVVGINHTSSKNAIELAQHAQSCGAKGCLVPSPYYFANSQGGVFEYLKQIDDEVNLELVFYDNPYSTKTFWRASELAELADKLKHMTALKITDHNIEKIAWLKANTTLSVFAGDDVVLFRSLMLGADGCMVIAPIIRPRAYQESWKLLKQNRVAESYRLYCEQVLPFIHVFGVGSEIAATKAIYKHLGIFSSDEVRAPLTACDETWRSQLITSYEVCRGFEKSLA